MFSAFNCLCIMGKSNLSPLCATKHTGCGSCNRKWLNNPTKFSSNLFSFSSIKLSNPTERRERRHSQSSILLGQLTSKILPVNRVDSELICLNGLTQNDNLCKTRGKRFVSVFIILSLEVATKQISVIFVLLNSISGSPVVSKSKNA